jgi:hypothetical protein
MLQLLRGRVHVEAVAAALGDGEGAMGNFAVDVMWRPSIGICR